MPKDGDFFYNKNANRYFVIINLEHNFVYSILSNDVFYLKKEPKFTEHKDLIFEDVTETYKKHPNMVGDVFCKFYSKNKIRLFGAILIYNKITSDWLQKIHELKMYIEINKYNL